MAYLPFVRGPISGSYTAPYYYVHGYNGTDINTAKSTYTYSTYGVLYNWTAAMQGEVSSDANPSGVQGVCPDGWHLPSHIEWDILINYLGGVDVAEGKLIESGTAHWPSPNIGATNESGFTGLPGGFRNTSGIFSYLTQTAFWSTVEAGTSRAIKIQLSSDHVGQIQIGTIDKPMGYSVRCIKD